MSRSSMVEFVTITMTFLFVLPVMFTLMVVVVMNSLLAPGIRIAQAGLIALVSGIILYGSVTYFIRRMQKRIQTSLQERV